MVAGFQPGENQNPLPRAAGRFDHHPPLAAPGPGSRSTSALVEPAVGAAMAAPAVRTPTPASASRPTNPSTETSTRYAAAAATVSSGASTTTTYQTWSRIDTRVEPTHQANQMNHSVSVGHERRNTNVDRVPTASTITQFPGFVRCFLLMASSFLCSTPVFHAGSPPKIVSIPYICRDGLPLSFSHFWLSTFDSSCLLVGSSLSSL